MKRRFMMWMTIVCILVVGGSVTKMTQNFIVSQKAETATIVNVANAGDRNVGSAAVTEETAAMAAGGADLETIAETVIEEVASEEVLVAASPKAPIDTTMNDAIQETVKSPLDPVVINDVAVAVEDEKVSYHAETFFERFAQTEQSALQLWDNVTPDNRQAYFTAAEQERILWDYELNHVYQVIRERLSEEENERLKVLEVEWIKERDLYAEKAAAKSGMKNAQNQNPEYTRALAEKTKERCYWLVSEYEEILNQD